MQFVDILELIVSNYSMVIGKTETDVTYITQVRIQLL